MNLMHLLLFFRLMLAIDSSKISETKVEAQIVGDQRIIFHHRLNPMDKKKLIIKSIESSNAFNFSVITQNGKIFILAPAYSTAKLVLKFNYDLSERRWKEIKTLLPINKGKAGINRLEFAVDNMTIDEFKKTENRIKHYFAQTLQNEHIKLSAISPMNKSLRIELMNDASFSNLTNNWMKSFCNTNFVDLESRDVTSVQAFSLFGSLKYRLRRCSIRTYQLDPNSLDTRNESLIEIYIGENQSSVSSVIVTCSLGDLFVWIVCAMNLLITICIFAI